MAINTDITTFGKYQPRAASHNTKSKSPRLFGMAFPFTNQDSGGYLRKASDVELIKNNIKQLILTKRGERVMLPNFGTNLKNYLMEPLDQALFSQIRREILESFTKYAKGVNLNKIQIFPGENSTMSGGHHLYIKLFCSLIDEDQITFEVNVNIQ